MALSVVNVDEDLSSSILQLPDDDASLESSTDDYHSAHSCYPVHTLLLSRHGDSIWNGGQPGVPETFTGWTDVPLSPRGVEEAKSLGRELTQRWESTIDACFTSTLQRAQMTAHYCYWAFAELPNNREIKRFVIDYRLNERHYGTLQGFSKEKVEKGVYGHGSSTVKHWRRSWHAVPPLLSADDPRRKHEITRFKEICGGEESRVPRGESLSQVSKDRIQPFIEEVLTPTLNKSPGDGGGTGLIVAHANSLRALIGAFVDVENDPVALRALERLRIPTGAPLILKYQALPDGSTRVCDLDGTPIEDSDCSSTDDPKPDLPVWPLSSVPIQSSAEI
ncbi:unnamed protein product [Cylindrotheca closterium]|uniref:phosphoglycerate mutase (2,3-diphosphoglycerate-dependent) n=1 Tax=Cylindrotheca closterium TaxID=2856 RepID=A0AAD2CHS8_9STRA|nr:unnamed protein product [Cylindrotheca closterium]